MREIAMQTIDIETGPLFPEVDGVVMKFWLICHFCPIQQSACLTGFEALRSRVAARDVFIPQSIVVMEID